MTGQELYALYLSNMERCTTYSIDSWDDLNILVKQAWKAMALDITSEIEEAVVEAIPGAMAGERTDLP